MTLALTLCLLAQERPETKRFDLKVDAVAAVDVVPMIAAAAGFKCAYGGDYFHAGDNADAKVSLDLKQATYYAAVEALCAAHGRLFYLVDEAGATVYAGPRLTMPKWESGPHRFIVNSVQEIVEDDFAQKTRTLRFEMCGYWQPGLRPVKIRNFKVTEAIDDTGQSLLPAVDALWEGVPDDGWFRDRFTLGGPGKGAKKVAKLRATAEYVYREGGQAETVPIEFDDMPLPGADK